MRDVSDWDSELGSLFLPNRGFSFVEVIIAMAATMVIMGAIFSLLARGLHTTPVEIERADLQAQARHALERISQDVLLAGADLPPEYPTFTPQGVNPELDRVKGQSDAIEIVGNFSRNAAGEETIRVLSFDGQTAMLETDPVFIEKGDLVLVYDDAPTNGSWMFGLVAAVQRGPNPALMLKTMPGDTVGEITLPWFIQSYNRSHPSSGFITPVSVVTYLTDIDDSMNGVQAERVLWRQLNWGEPSQVAYLENLQIRYFVGDTVDEHVAPAPIPKLRKGGTAGPQATKAGASKSGASKAGAKKGGKDDGLEQPPIPQPDPSEPLRAERLVRGVRINITSRSHQANLEGSTVLPEQSTREDGYLRVTFSTRVSTRNLLFGLITRRNFEGFN